MSPRCLAYVFTLAALAGMPRSADAQPSSAPAEAPTPEAVKRAEAFYKEGARLYLENKWAEAEAAFRSAWALNPTFDVAYNLGNAEYRLGKYRDAAEHFAFALHVWPLLSSTAGLRGIAEKRLAESRAFVGALTVKVNHEQAEVFVDGKAVGKAPLPREVFVTPGAHVVEAKLKGYLGAKEAVQIEKGAAKTIELKLAAIVPVEAPSSERVDAAKTKGGGASGTESAASDGGLRKKLIIAGIASSAAAVGAGVVFAIVSSVKASDAEDQAAALAQEIEQPPCLMTPPAAECEAIKGKIAASDTLGNVAIWSFVVGGALGAGTAIYALATPRTKSATSVRVVPIASANAAGLTLIGRW
jgi:hypothetical protein